MIYYGGKNSYLDGMSHRPCYSLGTDASGFCFTGGYFLPTGGYFLLGHFVEIALANTLAWSTCMRA